MNPHDDPHRDPPTSLHRNSHTDPHVHTDINLHSDSQAVPYTDPHSDPHIDARAKSLGTLEPGLVFPPWAHIPTCHSEGFHALQHQIHHASPCPQFQITLRASSAGVRSLNLNVSRCINGSRWTHQPGHLCPQPCPCLIPQNATGLFHLGRQPQN